MRNLMKLSAVLLMVVMAVTVKAQTLKFGHIDMQALISVMPERATAETQFNAFQSELEEVLGEMQKELQTKMTEFEGLGEAASEIKRNAKVQEIQDLQQRIQNYQVTAQQQLQQKQTDLLQPVFDKAEKAIADVAKENGLIYVFDIGPKVILYQSSQSTDVMPMVKKKLGIQ
ncbi:MAG: OmpH family outer membrane protein [Draconibacterium sp.]